MGDRSDLSARAVAIKDGERFGASLASRSFGGGAMASATPGGASFPAPASTGVAGRRPLVVIRFDRPGVEYEQPLYSSPLYTSPSPRDRTRPRMPSPA